MASTLKLWTRVANRSSKKLKVELNICEQTSGTVQPLVQDEHTMKVSGGRKKVRHAIKRILSRHVTFKTNDKLSLQEEPPAPAVGNDTALQTPASPEHVPTTRVKEPHVHASNAEQSEIHFSPAQSFIDDDRYNEVHNGDHINVTDFQNVSFADAIPENTRSVRFMESEATLRDPDMSLSNVVDAPFLAAEVKETLQLSHIYVFCDVAPRAALEIPPDVEVEELDLLCALGDIYTITPGDGHVARPGKSVSALQDGSQITDILLHEENAEEKPVNRQWPFLERIRPTSERKLLKKRFVWISTKERHKELYLSQYWSCQEATRAYREYYLSLGCPVNRVNHIILATLSNYIIRNYPFVDLPEPPKEWYLHNCPIPAGITNIRLEHNDFKNFHSLGGADDLTTGTPFGLPLPPKKRTGSNSATQFPVHYHPSIQEPTLLPYVAALDADDDPLPEHYQTNAFAKRADVFVPKYDDHDMSTTNIPLHLPSNEPVLAASKTPLPVHLNPLTYQAYRIPFVSALDGDDDPLPENHHPYEVKSAASIPLHTPMPYKISYQRMPHITSAFEAAAPQDLGYAPPLPQVSRAQQEENLAAMLENQGKAGVQGGVLTGRGRGVLSRIVQETVAMEKNMEDMGDQMCGDVYRSRVYWT